jgi:hypothetical protein
LAEPIDRSATRTSHVEVLNERSICGTSVPDCAIAFRKPIVAVRDEATSPRSAFAAGAFRNVVDSTSNEPAIDANGFVVMLEHLECTREVPEDERTPRFESAGSVGVSESL